MKNRLIAFLLLVNILLFSCDFSFITLANVNVTITPNITAERVASGTIVKLTASPQADIYYTTDGSNPKTSETKILYSNTYGVIITEDLTIKACGYKSGEFGETYSFSYKCDPVYFVDDILWDGVSSGAQINLDNAVKKFGKNSIRIKGNNSYIYTTKEIAIDSRYNYKLEFWAKTDGFSIEDSAYVSLLLKGGVSVDKHTDGSSGVYYGSFDKLFKFEKNQDWTHYQLDIKEYPNCKSILFTLGLKYDTGNFWVDGIKLTATQKENFPLTIENDGNVYGNNHYIKEGSNAQIVQTFNLRNKATNLEKGKLSYKIYNQNAPEKCVGEGSIDVSVDAFGIENFQVRLSQIKEYGLFRLDFYLKNDFGLNYKVGTINLSRIIDNNSINKDTIWGLCTNYTSSNPDALDDLGVSTIRFDLDWEKVESTEDVFRVPSYYDNMVNKCNENNIEPLLIINSHGWPSWYQYDRSTSGFPQTETQIAQFKEFVEFLVKHFKGKVKYYEFFNETDSWANVIDAAGYLKLMKAVYPVIKAADPEAKFAVGAMAGFKYDYCEDIFKNGGADYLDIFTFHPYIRPSAPEMAELAEKVEAMHKIITKYTDKKIPIWYTEIGYSTDVTALGVTFEQQRDYLVRCLAVSKSLGYVDRVIIYREDGYLNSPYDPEARFGILGGVGEKNGQAFPAAVALANFVRRIHNYTFSENLNLAKNVYIHKYKGTEKNLYLIWTAGKEIKLELKTNADSVQLYDTYGNLTNTELKGNKFTVTVNDQMLYLELESGANLEVVAETVTKDNIVVENVPNIKGEQLKDQTTNSKDEKTKASEEIKEELESNTETETESEIENIINNEKVISNVSSYIYIKVIAIVLSVLVVGMIIAVVWCAIKFRK